MGLFYICHVLKNGLLLCALFWILVFTILATDPVAEGLATTPSVSLQEAGEQLYLKHVRPLFEERCQMCHTGESGQGEFDLSTAEGLFRGGKRGQAVIPGNAGGSLLYKLVTHAQEPVMPQKAAKLSPEAIALIEFWINVGAPTGSAASTTSSTVPNPPVVALAENALSPAVTLFAEKIRPVLQEQCFTCHGGKFKQAGLSLATREALLRAATTGRSSFLERPTKACWLRRSATSTNRECLTRQPSSRTPLSPRSCLGSMRVCPTIAPWR